MWWPLVPGATDLSRLRWQPPVASPPSRPGAVLARLADLDATFAGTPVGDLLSPAYPALAGVEEAAGRSLSRLSR